MEFIFDLPSKQFSRRAAVGHISLNDNGLGHPYILTRIQARNPALTQISHPHSCPKQHLLNLTEREALS